MPLVVVTGERGSGKTSACVALLGSCRDSGIPIAGVLSPRHFRGSRPTGYDCLDCSTGNRFPLCRIPAAARGPDWVRFASLRYLFSEHGLARANLILRSAGAAETTVAFVDEVGRLEMEGAGLHGGLMSLLDSLPLRPVCVASCRLEVVSWIEDLARQRSIETISWRPGGALSLEALTEEILSARSGL